jgi:hypothetical protein
MHFEPLEIKTKKNPLLFRFFYYYFTSKKLSNFKKIDLSFQPHMLIMFVSFLINIYIYNKY